MAGNGFTDKGVRIQPVATYNPETGEYVAGGGGGGSGDASASNQVTGNTRLGDVTETAPASDTASSGLNGRLQRIAQRLTSFMALFPASLGVKAGGASLAVALSTEDAATLAAIATAAGDTTTPLPIKGQAPITRLTPTILTSAYTTGTVLFATTSIANLVPANDQPVVLESLFVVDKDDEGVAITLHFFSANVALGTAGSAPSISDAAAASAWLGSVDIATGDYKDLGGVKVASLKGIGLNLAPASGTRNVYVAATVTGTPTFTATSDLVFGFGVLG